MICVQILFRVMFCIYIRFIFYDSTFDVTIVHHSIRLTCTQVLVSILFSSYTMRLHVAGQVVVNVQKCFGTYLANVLDFVSKCVLTMPG